MWSFGPQDPDANNFSPEYHHDKRGVQNVYLKAKGTDTIFPDDDNLDPHIKYFDVAVSEVS